MRPSVGLYGKLYEKWQGRAVFCDIFQLLIFFAHGILRVLHFRRFINSELFKSCRKCYYFIRKFININVKFIKYKTQSSLRAYITKLYNIISCTFLY